jgi:hypothetical protein
LSIAIVQANAWEKPLLISEEYGTGKIYLQYIPLHHHYISQDSNSKNFNCTPSKGSIIYLQGLATVYIWKKQTRNENLGP